MDLIQFIISYFLSKHVAHITAFLCSNKGDLTRLYRGASSNGMRLRVQTKFHEDLRFSPEGLNRPEGVLLDMDCPSVRDVIEQASNSRAFNQRHIWLLLDNSLFNSLKLDSSLENAAILPDSDVVWSSPDIIVEIYRVNLKHPIRLSRLELSRNSRLQEMSLFWARRPSAVTRRSDLENMTVNAVAVITQPEYFTTWDDTSLKHIDTLSKAAHPLIILLGEDLNLSYNFSITSRYGEEVNGSFTGGIGYLERNADVEIVASIILWRRDRMRHAQYITETFILRFPFIFRQPPKSAVTNIFILPLSPSVWVSSLIVFLLVTGFLAVFTKYMVDVDPALHVITTGETITFVIGAICQQGFHWTPNLQSIRVMMLFTFITSLFLFTSYSAKIVALLQTPSHAIQTVSDLAQSQLACGVQDVPYKKIYYKENPPPATKYLYEHKLRPFGEKAFSYSVTEGVAKLRTGEFAFQAELSAAIDIIQETFTESEKCGLNFIDTFRLGKLGIPFKRHSGLKELAAVRFRWQRENGLMDHVFRTWFARQPRCESGRINGFVSIGLKETLPAIQVLAFGAGLAVLVLIQEIIVNKISVGYSKPMRLRAGNKTIRQKIINNVLR